MKIVFYLSDEQFNALSIMAEENSRKPKQQAFFLLKQALTEGGYIREKIIGNIKVDKTGENYIEEEEI